MRISHRYRFVFFANPKAGSSSVRHMLDPYTDVFPARNFLERTKENPFYPHMRPAEARTQFEERSWEFNLYHRFAIVRNPWARLVSLYSHIRRAGETSLPFRQWIYTATPSGDGGGGPEWAKWRRYGSWSIRHFVGDADGKPLVDTIFRLEDIETAFPVLLEEIGIPDCRSMPILHRNIRSDGRSYTEFYNPATRQHVARNYAYDIETYDYQFGG